LSWLAGILQSSVRDILLHGKGFKLIAWVGAVVGFTVGGGVLHHHFIRVLARDKDDNERGKQSKTDDK
jgi:hypothetical protein